MLEGRGRKPAGEYETGTLTIAVIQSDRSASSSPRSLPIALHVADVAAAREELRARASVPGDTLDSGVCHMAHFADPDGNALMLHSRYAPKDAKPGS